MVGHAGPDVPRDPRDDLVLAYRVLATAGVADLIWGHVSIRDQDGRGFWMKASGYGSDEITRAELIHLDFDGEILEGTGPRHVEYPIHAEILRARPDAGAVVHAHTEAVNAFAALETELRALSHDGVLFAGDGLPRYTRTGGLISDAELGADVARCLNGAPACLLVNHGMVTAATSLAHAVMYAVLLERACRTQLMAMAAGPLLAYSDDQEVALKRAQCWPSRQLDSGWDYLCRTVGARS